MKSAVLALLLGIAYSSPLWKQIEIDNWDEIDHKVSWEDWKEEFGKTYGDINEEAHRFLVFLDNWKMINDFNTADNTYTMMLNQFGDLTFDEFRYYVHGHGESCVKSKESDDTPIYGMYQLPTDVPQSIDWTNMNGSSYVTPVKNQGQCGSCWAFSTTGSIEARSAIKNGWTGTKIISLSEQQLVDCSKAEGNQGCNGGLMEDAFKYVQKEGGLCTESDYPYTARDGTCKATSCGTKQDPITGYKVVTKDSEPSLQSAVADGPVSVSVDAAGSAWQFYHGGVVDGQCGVLLDHGVLAVGYGHDTKSKLDYWKVKNSWGKTWGEEGYIQICRNCNKNEGMGECGILRDDSYPLV